MTENFLEPDSVLTQQLEKQLATVCLNQNNIACAAFQFTLSNYSDALFEQFAIEQPERWGQWVEKRKAEYLAGRMAAKQSLQYLNEPLQTIQTGPHREPVWPTGIHGTISHNSNTAIAIVSRYERFLIGVDIENLIRKDTTVQASHLFLDKNEQRLIEHSPEPIKTFLPTAIFSAKESFFKAAFRKVKRYFDFDAIRCVRVTDHSLTFTTNMAFPELHPWLSQEQPFEINYLITTAPTMSVTTLVMLEQKSFF